MKLSKLIKELQNFDPDMDVCRHDGGGCCDDSWDGEESIHTISVSDYNRNHANVIILELPKTFHDKEMKSFEKEFADIISRKNCVDYREWIEEDEDWNIICIKKFIKENNKRLIKEIENKLPKKMLTVGYDPEFARGHNQAMKQVKEILSNFK